MQAAGADGTATPADEAGAPGAPTTGADGTTTPEEEAGWTWGQFTPGVQAETGVTVDGAGASKVGTGGYPVTAGYVTVLV